MAEEKIKVKDLATEINVPTRDALRALRELGFAAKSLSGSLSFEEAISFRNYFDDKKADTVNLTSNQPNVIVRRRKKEQLADAAAAPAPKKETEPKQAEKETANAAQRQEKADNAPQAKEQKPKEQKQKQRSDRQARRQFQNIGARVISRPTDEKPAPAPEPVPAQAKPKQEVRQGKTLAEEIREREAAKVALARKDAEVLRKKIERGAAIISRPEIQKPEKPEPVSVLDTPLENIPAEADAPIKKTAAETAAKETAKPQAANTRQNQENISAQHTRHASSKPRIITPPAFSAKPDGSGFGENAEKAQAQVRVISRPMPSKKPKNQQFAKENVRPEQKQQKQQGSQPRSAGYDMPFGNASRNSQLLQMPAQMPDAREGQSKKKRLKGRRTVDFQQGDFGRHMEDDDNLHFNRSKAKRKAAKPQPQQVTQPVKAVKRKIRVAEAIRVADMAQQMGIKANEIIKILFGLGIMATINQALDLDTATLVAAEFDYEIEKTGFFEEDYLEPKEADSPESLKPRPPVVTIMGHVDHGKTSLLDAIRKSNVTSGEAGGITQHIGAYHVTTKRGEIVFLDTPGHEAFTAMRARGAKITDLVILVVAADDGVMEQTREAVNHSRAANVPIVVAVNKMDKPGADPDRVLRELAELGLQPEDWGGDTIVAKVSAKTRAGLDDLLELVALQSEIMDLKANPDKLARGRIVEAKLDKGRGPIATVLIQEGTLKTGDTFVCGSFAGRVRALLNDQGKKVKDAGPSMPVEVQGFDGVPEAGEEFMAVADDKLARRIADSRAIKRRERELASEARVTLETFLTQSESEEVKTLNLVLKADVQGSQEAITEALQKQISEKVKINMVHGGTGAISESDIMLASASKAIIIGFNVRPAARIKEVAEKENVDIRYYDIIYKLVDDVKSAMAGMLAPVQKEVYLGQAEVRKVYNLPKVGAIAGSYVADGKIVRNSGVRLLRDGIVAYTGRISSLKRFKEDAREVVKGNECGVGLENFNDIKTGDIIEAFETVEEAATL